MEDAIYDKINDWLEGSLSDEDKKAFEKEMENNPDLAREVNLAKSAMAAINEKEVIDFRNQMAEIMSEEMPPSKKNIKSWKRVLVIGGLLVLVLLAFLFFNKKEKENTATPLGPVALYEKYFAAPEQLISNENTRTETDLDSLKKNIGLLIGKLNSQFQEKEYSEAFITLDSLKKIDPRNKFIQNKDFNFSKGLLYLNTDQYQPAIEAFQEANKNMAWDDVEWYMAAACIKLGKFSEAEMILKKLVSSNNPVYENQVKALLEDLKNME